MQKLGFQISKGGTLEGTDMVTDKFPNFLLKPFWRLETVKWLLKSPWNGIRLTQLNVVAYFPSL